MRLLNIGCGRVAHPAWINYDLVPVPDAPHVRVHDLRTGIPEPDASVDACYSSHVLEHLQPADATPFLREQHRVLKPGGILRIVVPDLEAIARNYCAQLDAALSGEAGAEFRYDYTLLELYDQMVRTTHGGQMGVLWKSGRIPDLPYVGERHGREALDVIYGLDVRSQETARLVDRFRRKGAKIAVRLLLGKAGEDALEEGRFRQCGEIHRWMYDRFSLRRLLERHGFTGTRVVSATESQIPSFATYGLDANNGAARKPDSLFMEANKPTA